MLPPAVLRSPPGYAAVGAFRQAHTMARLRIPALIVPRERRAWVPAGEMPETKREL